MRVEEAMSKKPEFLPPTASIKEAAIKMKELNCGFIPVGENDKLIGAVTDRDIILRTFAEGKDPNNATLQEIMTSHIEYCFEDDGIEEAVKHMENKQIHRLVVLNREKRMIGILSLGDISRKCHDQELSGEAVEGILADKKRAH